MNAISHIEMRSGIAHEILPAGARSIEALRERSAVYATEAHGTGTRVAYRKAWLAYEGWCLVHGANPLSGSPETLALYLTDKAEAGLTVSTLRVHVAAIRMAHRLAGKGLDLSDPHLSMVWEGIQRAKGVAPRRKAAPAVPDVLRRMMDTRKPWTAPAGARDRAMLLVGFGAALRRSELVALTIRDVVPVPGRGLLVTIRRSKTDQRGEGRTVAIAANHLDREFCPMVALDRWMALRKLGPDQGAPDRPLFCEISRTGRILTGDALLGRTVARLVKDAAGDAGFDESLFSGHSLRRGFLTAGASARVQLTTLGKHARQADPRTTMGYIEEAEAWTDNASAAVFAGCSR